MPPAPEASQAASTPALPPPSPALPPSPQLTIAPLRKAAILIVTLGEEVSKLLLKNMGEAEVQRLTEELARMGDVTPDEQTQVLLEFYGLQETQQYILRGGPEYASRLLTETFGRQRADELLRDASFLRANTPRPLRLCSRT